MLDAGNAVRMRQCCRHYLPFMIRSRLICVCLFAVCVSVLYVRARHRIEKLLVIRKAKLYLLSARWNNFRCRLTYNNLCGNVYAVCVCLRVNQRKKWNCEHHQKYGKLNRVVPLYCVAASNAKSGTDWC